jgi:putative DNA primase/helicase
VTGGIVDEDGRAVLDAIHTYAELSPSGTGLHIIGRGSLPPGARRRGPLEVYDSGRYFAMTGHRLPDSPIELSDCTAALTEWHARMFGGNGGNGHHAEARRATPSIDDDGALIDRARLARNGAKFATLWAGDWSGYPSQSEADGALCMMLAFWTDRDGARVDRLFRQSGLMRDKWDEQRGAQTYGERTIATAIVTCSETYADRPNTTDVGAPASVERRTFNLTDSGNAEFLAFRHGHDLRFDHRRGRWLLWREGRWRSNMDPEIRRLAKTTMRQRFRDAAKLEDPDARSRAAKWAIASESRVRLDALVHLAQVEQPIADDGIGWDSDPGLLGTLNGVVDLRTGVLRPARREDRMTLVTSVAYDPNAQSHLWENALKTILLDEALIQFVQVAVGYSATGDTREDRWFLPSGSGRNGKGTLLQPIAHALGDYALELPGAVFDQRADRSPYELSYLPGRRFVTSSESGDTIRLNHDRIKQLTGGDSVSAANKYEKAFTFEPTCKLWLACNKKPRTTDDTAAFWARVLMVPFTVSFVGKEDRSLRPALVGDPVHQAAVLAWIVRGAVRYYAEGLPEPPSAVRAATHAYRQECDPLAAFVDEACDLNASAQVGARELFEHYARWANDQHYTEKERLSATMFGRLVGYRFDSQKDPRTGVKHYRGIARKGAF